MSGQLKHQKQQQAQESKESSSKKLQQQKQALERALENDSQKNFEAIFEGFIDKGIPEEEIKPRINVFTFNAWKALDRVVKKGESGVKVITYIDVTKINPETGEKEPVTKKRVTTVFHISQTEPLNNLSVTLH